MVMTAAESAMTITVFFFTNCSIADRMHTLFILFALLLFLSFIFSPFAFFAERATEFILQNKRKQSNECFLCLVAAIWFEQMTLRVWTECSSQLSYAAVFVRRGWCTTAIEMVAGEGLEPPTSGLWARRATDCSTPRWSLPLELSLHNAGAMIPRTEAVVKHYF